MKSFTPALGALCALGCLSACGGGGDSPASAGTTSVAISSANQVAVARVVFNAAFSLGLVQGVADGTAASPAGVSATVLREAVQAVRAGRRETIASARPAASTSASVPCALGGTLATTWNDHDNDGQLDSGDVLTVASSQCRDSSTLSIDGTLVITLTAAPSDTAISASAQFQNLAAVDTGVTYRLSGPISLTETDTGAVSTVSFTVGGGGLSSSVASAGYNDTLVYDAGAVVAGTFRAGSTTTSLDGSLTSQSLGGRVGVATSQPFTQSSGDAYPGAGQAVITGGAGGKLVATAIDATNAQLQLDANADGVFESTTTVAWTSLLP